MIDVSKETLLTPDEARRQIPGRGKIDLCSIYRYMNRGLQGVRLEYVRVLGRQMTSKEALARFFQRLTDAAEAKKIDAAKKAGKPIVPAIGLTRNRQRDLEAAKERLARRPESSRRLKAMATN
jgi:hypothetical protein